MKSFYVPPTFIRRFFKHTQWCSITDRILLTFDDSPDESSTIKILDKLAVLNLQAVFFCRGDRVKKHPELAQEIFNRGHKIGNHSFNHVNLLKCSTNRIHAEIEATKVALEEIGIKNQKYFRPPYGLFDFRTLKIIKKLGYNNIMWSLLTFDYKNNLKVVKFAIDNYLKCDSIVVFHDNKSACDIITDSIDYIYEYSAKNNYSFGKPVECLHLK